MQEPPEETVRQVVEREEQERLSAAIYLALGHGPGFTYEGGAVEWEKPEPPPE